MVPLSIGDVIYIIWVIVGMIFILKTIYALIRGRWKDLLLKGLKAVSALLWLYFSFLLLWGAHYRQNTLTQDLHYDLKRYTTADLYQLTDTLLKLANRDKIAVQELKPLASGDMFKIAADGYKNLSDSLPFLRYDHPSVKSSLFGEYMNYLGVTGYMNPFTLEAQVNTTVPPFIQPFTTCHEIAHQVGYAPEEAANFIGFIVASRVEDVRFRYAANFEMLLYSIRQLGRRNHFLARELWENASEGVREDVRRLSVFYRKYEGPVDDYTTALYDQYLKANQQAQGIRSYSEVVGWLMAYYRI